MKQITFYGKGGIGKSTIAANVAAALAQAGLRVLQMGCDPKHDSTITLVNGTFIPTILDTVRKVGTSISRLEHTLRACPDAGSL